MKTLFSFIAFLVYGALVVLAGLFAVNNRTALDLSFYPLPYTASIPVYLLVLFVFIAGLLVGLSHSFITGLGKSFALRQARLKTQVLENELAVHKHSASHISHIR